MRQKKTAASWAAILASFAILFTAAAAFAAPGTPSADEERASQLKAALGKKFAPEWMEVSIEGGPDEKGFVKKASVRAKGAVIDKLRVDSLVMEAADIQFNDPADWDRKLKVRSAGLTKSRGVILERDINAAMVKSLSRDKKWKSISMDLSPQRIKAVGVYETHFLFKLRFLVKLTGILAASPDGKQIYIRDYKINVSGMTMPQGLTEDVIEKVQPIIDFRESVFPVSVKKIVMDDESISFVSDPPPAVQ